MLTLEELLKIRARFKAARADRPMRLEQEHCKFEDMGTVDLGWNVLSAKGHGLKGVNGAEFDICYASHTTREAGEFLVGLPVDFAQLLETCEYFLRRESAKIRGTAVPDEPEAICEACGEYEARCAGGDDTGDIPPHDFMPVKNSQ